MTEITFVAFILCRIDERYDGDNDDDDNDDTYDHDNGDYDNHDDDDSDDNNNDSDYDRLVIKQDKSLLLVVIISLSSTIVQTGR